MHRKNIPAGLLSIVTSTTFFTLALSIGLDDSVGFGFWPIVFVIAGMQHLFIVAPVHLLITRLWRPVASLPLWSFTLWGMGLAAAPWVFVLYGWGNLLIALIAASGAVGGLFFGWWGRSPSPAP